MPRIRVTCSPAITLRLLIALADGDAAAADDLAARVMKLDEGIGLDRTRSPPGDGGSGRCCAPSWPAGRRRSRPPGRLEDVGWRTALAEPNLIRAALDRLATVAAG